MPTALRTDVSAVDLHGLGVRIVCPLPDVSEAIEARLAHLPTRPAAGCEITLEFVPGGRPHRPPREARPVYESEHGIVLYAPGEDELFALYGEGVTLRCRPSLGHAEVSVPLAQADATWLLSRPMITLPLMECARRRGLHPVHAACVARDGRGVLLTGPSGAGKSTLALALVEAGFDFLSDDLVFLAGGPKAVRALGFPDELGVSPGTASLLRLEADIPTAPDPGWPKARIDVLDVAAPTIVPECTPHLLVVLSLEEEADRPLELTAGDALLELLPSVLLTHPEACSAHLAILGALADGVRSVRCAARADVSELAETIEEQLSESTLQPKELTTT